MQQIGLIKSILFADGELNAKIYEKSRKVEDQEKIKVSENNQFWSQYQINFNQK